MTAATVTARGVPMIAAIGKPIGINMAKVPQEEPVANDMQQPIKNRIAGSTAGFKKSCVTSKI